MGHSWFIDIFFSVSTSSGWPLWDSKRSVGSKINPCLLDGRKAIISIHQLLPSAAKPETSSYTVYPSSLIELAIICRIVWWRWLRSTSLYGQAPRTWARVSYSLWQCWQRELSWDLPGRDRTGQTFAVILMVSLHFEQNKPWWSLIQRFPGVYSLNRSTPFPLCGSLAHNWSSFPCNTCRTFVALGRLVCLERNLSLISMPRSCIHLLVSCSRCLVAWMYPLFARASMLHVLICCNLASQVAQNKPRPLYLWGEAFTVKQIEAHKEEKENWDNSNQFPIYYSLLINKTLFSMSFVSFSISSSNDSLCAMHINLGTYLYALSLSSFIFSYMRK